MNIFVSIYEQLSTKVAKFYIGAFVALVASIFTFVQWVLPLYWERQPNFEVSFVENDNGRVIQAEPLIGENEQCLISGAVKIKNNSKAPLSLRNTHIVLIPYEVKRCPISDSNCVSSQNRPLKVTDEQKPLVDTTLSKLSEKYHHTTILPVTRGHDLFSEGVATRPFSLLIPTKHVYNERMIVLAEQEYGDIDCVQSGEKKAWNQSFCETSRAVINLSWPCIPPIKAEQQGNVEVDKKE